MLIPEQYSSVLSHFYCSRSRGSNHFRQSSHGVCTEDVQCVRHIAFELLYSDSFGVQPLPPSP